MVKLSKSQIEDDDFDEKNQKVIGPPYYQRIFNLVEHHFYFLDQIGPPSDYVHVFHALNTASENDMFFFHLNTNGGRLDTGVQLINAIRNTQGTVTMILQSEAHSLGTLLLLSGDNIIVNDHTRMMFHNFSSGISGKGQDMAAELESTIKWYRGIAEEICIPFLSKKELNDIMKGKDIWMGAEEIRKRLERINVNKEETNSTEDE